MRARNIIAGALLGTGAGLLVGAAASDVFEQYFPHTYESSTEAAAFNRLEDTGSRILVSLSALGGLASGSIIALGNELDFSSEQERRGHNAGNYQQ